MVFKRIIDKIGDKFLSITLSELMDIYEQEEYYKINGFRIEEYKARILEQGEIKNKK